jgi:WD40 repeat protein
MERARWNQIEELLQEALDLAPDERAAFLKHACGADDELARELGELLQREDEGAVLEAPALASLARINPSLIGSTIGHYRIEAQIGSGGMGDVYEARDERLQRTVAVKVLPAEFTADPERVERFEREALAASRLNHPNIVTIFEFVHDGGFHFIVTERIEGSTLRDLMTDRLKPALQIAAPRWRAGFSRPGVRKAGVMEAIEIAMQIATALEAAHTAWIIHRDIKPENVMLRADGLVKVLDFGIAKRSDAAAEPQSCFAPVADHARENGDLTRTGAILGTATYMSPEQSRGEELDGRTDLYSLGLVLFEMLRGSRFDRDDPALDQVPGGVQRIVGKLLREERAERYSSAAELREDLAREKRRLETRSARGMVITGAVAVAAALAIAAIAALLSVHESWGERVLRDGHGAAARQAVFSPDGRLLVSCGEDGQVIVWDFARRQRLATLTGAAVHKVAFSPDGRWLAAGAVDGTITIRDARRFTTVAVLRGHGAEIGSLAFSPDSKLLASADARFTTVAWKTAGWTRRQQWPTTSSAHGTFIFSFDGKHILQANCLTIHDLDGTFVQTDGRNGANWIAQSPDQSRLASVDTFGNFAVYRLEPPGDVRNPRLIERRRAHQDHGRAVAYSPDGSLIATGSEHVLLWDAATLQKLARFEHPAIVWNLTFSPDGRSLVSTHADGAVLVWSVAERECIANLNEHGGAVRAVAFSPDGRHVASGSEDRTVSIWDALSGRRERIFAGHQTRVTAVAYSQDGKQLASTDQDGMIVLHDAARGTHRVLAGAAAIPGYSIAISPDGRLLVTTRGVFAMADGRFIAGLSNSPGWSRGQLYGGVFSHDGTRFFCVTDAGWMLFWDTARWRLLEAMRVPDTRLISVSLSPDGRSLVTGEDQGAVRLWSVTPLRPIAVVGRHAARVKSVAFSPDGKSAASAGDDKTIALWDVERLELRSRIGVHASPIYAIAFSPDGKQLVSAEHDHSVRIYTRERKVWGIELE